MKKLTSAVVASSLVLGAVSTAFAAPAADEVNTAYARLNHYNVVQGVAQADGTVSAALDQDITRAQLITIVTRAFGQEENAKLLTGATTGYADVDGNEAVKWATGYIFMGQRIADQKGIKIGRPGNLFAPSENVSQIEALAFIMKYLGIEVGSGDTWVEDTIANAKAAGLVTDAEVATYLANPNAKANRGHVFGLLDGIFATYNKLEGGKTVYTTYVDTKAPELTVDEPALTTDKTAVTITGSVKGEFSSLFLGSEAITANEDGTFSVEVPLTVGANAITVTAVDLAGNTAESTFTVTRNAGVATAITASLASSVEAGTATDLTFEITDANGVALEVPAADLTVTVGGNIGTVVDGVFTASETAGTGTVTVGYGDLTPVTVDVTVAAGALANLVADKASVAKGETIKLTATDKYGNAIASGVTFTWEGTGIAVTNAGVVYTSEAGKYAVTATAGEASATTSVGVYSTVAALTVSTAESVVANGTTRVKVSLAGVDEFGNIAGNFASKVGLSGVGVTFYDAATGGNVVTEIDAKDGVATVYASVGSIMAGEQVTISANQQGVATVKGETKLTAVAAVASGLKAEAGSKTLAANQAATEGFTVTVVDQAGVAVNGVYTVTAAVTGPAKLTTSATASYAKAAGSAASTANFTVSNAEFVGTEGTIAGTFSVEGVGTATASINHIIAGNPAKLAVTTDKETVAASAGATFKYTVELQDRRDVSLAAPAATTLNVSMPDAYEGKFTVLAADATTVIAAEADGTWNVTLAQNSKTATFYVQVNGKHTGDVAVSVKGTVSGVDVAGSKSVAVTTGAAKGVALDRSGIVYASVAEPKATFVASLADHFGNAVAASDVELSVYAVDGASATNITVNGKNATAGDTLKVKTNAEGKAVLELSARPYSGRTYDLVVSYTKDGVTTTDTVALGILDQVAASMTTKVMKQPAGATSFITNPNSISAGEEFYVVVSVKDNYGGALDLTGLKLTAPAGTVSIDGTTLANQAAIDGASFNAYNAVGAPTGLQTGDHWIKLVGGKAGVASVGAKYEALQNTISASSTIAVQAGALNKIAANGGTDIEVTGTSKVEGPYTLTLVDKFGNVVVLNAATTISSTAPAAVTLRAEAGGATVTSFTTKSATNFFFVATAVGTHTVNFSAAVDTDGNGTAENYTGSATIKVTE